jgi:hypothetical protein
VWFNQRLIYREKKKSSSQKKMRAGEEMQRVDGKERKGERWRGGRSV